MAQDASDISMVDVPTSDVADVITDVSIDVTPDVVDDTAADSATDAPAEIATDADLDAAADVVDDTAADSATDAALDVPMFADATGPAAQIHATSISAGSQLACAVLTDTSVSCWGDNLSGQLGNGTIGGSSALATPVVGVGGTGHLMNAVQVSVYTQTACARLMDGTVVCWGAGNGGQLGDGMSGFGHNRATPAPVMGLTNVVDLAVGPLHACAVQSSGSVQCWGGNDSGQLGDGTTTLRTTPVPVTGVSNATQVVAADVNATFGMRGFTCARIADGTVQCWGGNSTSQLGDGMTTDRPTASAVSGLTNVVEIAAGIGHVCVRLMDGTLSCWGDNRHAYLSTASSALVVTTPMPVVDDSFMPFTGVTTLRAGGLQRIVLRTDGLTYSWGEQSHGELGRPNILPHSPGLVAGPDGTTLFPPGVLQTSPGSRLGCLIAADQGVWCFGANYSGEVGDGTTMQRNFPVPVIHP